MLVMSALLTAGTVWTGGALSRPIPSTFVSPACSRRSRQMDGSLCRVSTAIRHHGPVDHVLLAVLHRSLAVSLGRMGLITAAGLLPNSSAGQAEAKWRLTAREAGCHRRNMRRIGEMTVTKLPGIAAKELVNVSREARRQARAFHSDARTL